MVVYVTWWLWWCLIEDCASREAPVGEEAAGELISPAVSSPRDELQSKNLALQGLRKKPAALCRCAVLQSFPSVKTCHRETLC